MNKKELDQLLEVVYGVDFLNGIEILLDEEPKYKKSEFFKKTKIPLMTLYEKYFHWKKLETTIKDELLSFVYNLDEDIIIKTLTSMIKKIESSDEVKAILTSITSSFDTADLKNLSEELQETVSKLK